MMYSKNMERARLCESLFAIIGPPPGLTLPQDEMLIGPPPGLTLPQKDLYNDCWDQSTTASRSSRSSSLSSQTTRNSIDCEEPCFFETCSQDSQTTLIIRNIARHCTRKMLLDFMDRQGFHREYNLVYLPMRFADSGNFCYAFVNFVSESMAMKFQETLNGCDDEDIFGENCAEISWSQCQGLDANIEKFRNSSAMHPSVDDECRPLLLKNGKVVAFPQPTQKIKQDRRKRREVNHA